MRHGLKEILSPIVRHSICARKSRANSQVSRPSCNARRKRRDQVDRRDSQAMKAPVCENAAAEIAVDSKIRA